MATIHHPELGKFRVTSTKGVIQFLGVKYATLRNRFGEPVLHNGAGASSDNVATEQGPCCINAPDACEREFDLIQQKLPLDAEFQMSDTECLRLNITTPEVQALRPLPVLVFVHGGALRTGSGTWPQYDFRSLVMQSVQVGSPFIGVSMNYRTSIFGFLTSVELRAAGFKPNSGLRDQKVAFEWIQKYIQGFGGDPSQATALGQSAGGASLTLLLQSEEALFQHLVIMSGTCLLLRPVSGEVHEAIYQEFCEAQGLDKMPGQERIKAIEELDSFHLFSNTPPSIPPLPMIDGDIVKVALTFDDIEQWSTHGSSSIPGLGWCKELLIGDCQMDGHIYQLALNHRKRGIARAFEESLKRSCSHQDDAVISLFSDYQINESISDDDAFWNIPT
ncbi:hypothetical protein PV10_05255 [Exophiala mesophila]|uniref:Carboxylesterase type B domain-containing protein n=1 Tax=Exophiala mesophila TaxID=212818 RepID=A0A0D1WXH6_EXOME|nr:uncharacterized protein PV10_05255 [Exophiala mesophila]KIV94100.1 hypothetical protein PV10_05255 [Exophiala mesophila]